MGVFSVRGGVPLYGTVRADGSKNAVLPLLFASLAVEGETVLHRVPDISDVTDALALLEGFGVRSEREGDSVRLDARRVRYCVPDAGRIARLRASTYLLGACLARFGRADVLPWGGCTFSARPVDLHFLAAETFGAIREGNCLTAKRLRGGTFCPKKVSVGATVNALLMACAAEGNSRIVRYAAEPHVLSLIGFLNVCGAKITVNDDGITVSPRVLHGAEYTVIPDMIEAGTYLLCGPMTGGKVCVDGADETHLQSLRTALEEGGFSLKKDERGALYAERCGKAKKMAVCAQPYPGFPTDLQPIFAAFAASQAGASITDEVFAERFGYLDGLSSFGVRSEGRILRAEIHPSEFRCADVVAQDLRGGAAMILSALCASGTSTVSNAELPMRGYADMERKLSSLGAKIRFLKTG